MSIPPCQNGGMKNRLLPLVKSKTEMVVASFGRAGLVCRKDGSLELRGGQPGDRTAAKEWISLFMHEAVPSSPLKNYEYRRSSRKREPASVVSQK